MFERKAEIVLIPKNLHLYGISRDTYIKERIQIKSNIAVTANDQHRENKINGAMLIARK